MLADIKTVFWKEWKELTQMRGVKGYMFNWVILVLLIGVYMPIQAGVEWFTTPLVLLLWSWPPMLLISGMVADSFAGEKERHTLETLLASRLPDTSILIGKVLSGLAYAGTLFPAALLLGAVTLNLIHRPAAGFLFYSPALLAQVLGLHYLMLLLIAGIGVWISMNSTTVRSAYQKLSGAMLVIAVAPSVSIGLLPEATRAQLLTVIMQARLGPETLAVAAVIVALDALLFWGCLKRFKRDQLLAV